MKLFLGLVLAILTLAGAACAADWNQFRGPNADGVATGVSIPQEWGTDRNIRWKVKVPGTGFSSPVIAGPKVFLTSCIEETGERLLLCHDLASGKEEWRSTVLRSPLETRHQLSSCANSTPLATSTLVYVSFLDKDRHVLTAFEHGGKEVWRKDLGQYVNKHGFCSTPMFQNGLLVLAADNDAKGFVTALDPATGESKWRHNRDNSVRSFSIPVPGKDAGQMLVAGCRSLTSFEPKTGKVNWRVETPTEKFVAAPAITGGMAVLSGSSPTNTLWGINLAGGGVVAWKESANALYTCSPVAAQGLVFGVTDQGIAWCLDPKTGKKQWTERLGKAHHASLISVNKTILAFDRDGICHMIEASPVFKKISVNSLNEEIHATPAVVSDGLIIRTNGHLIRVGE